MHAYVSSTFRDLKTCRARVSEVLRRLDFLDVAMEHYGADERRPVERCVQDVSSSDLYVGVVAFRRGYVPDENNPDELSITEMEYEAAKANGIDTLVFLLHEDAPWPRSLMDDDMAAVDAFRDRISAETSADRFHSADDLAAKVTQAVADWVRRQSAAPPVTQAADLATYRSAVERRYGVLDLDVLVPPESGDPPPIRLKSVFVEPTLQPGTLHVPLPAPVRRRLEEEGASPEAARFGQALRPPAPAFSALASSQNRHVILGQPGAGKSTLIRAINGLVPATSGTITVGPSVVTGLRGRRLRQLRGHIGMIFQGFNLADRASVYRNVLVGRFAHTSTYRTVLGLTSAVDRELALQSLDSVGMLEKVWTRAGQLSGGQKQRVAIARALTQQPSVMLADEPVASLDPPTAHAVMNDLRRINVEDGLTVLVNIHLMDLARQYTTRMIGLRGGELVYDGLAADATDADFEQIYGRPIQPVDRLDR